MPARNFARISPLCGCLLCAMPSTMLVSVQFSWPPCDTALLALVLASWWRFLCLIRLPLWRLSTGRLHRGRMAIDNFANGDMTKVSKTGFRPRGGSRPAFAGYLLDAYDVVFCDVWGVLHNVVEPYARRRRCLAVSAAGGTVVCDRCAGAIRFGATLHETTIACAATPGMPRSIGDQTRATSPSALSKDHSPIGPRAIFMFRSMDLAGSASPALRLSSHRCCETIAAKPARPICQFFRGARTSAAAGSAATLTSSRVGGVCWLEP